MAKFTQTVWADKMMRATPEVRRTMAQELGRGAHEITDEAGQLLSLHLEPMICATARPVELKRDNSGRVIVKPVEPIQATVEPRGEIDMDRFRSQMKVIENFNEEDKRKATKAIYLEHLGVEI